MSTPAQAKIFGMRLGVDPKLLVGGLIALAVLLFWYNSRGDEHPSTPGSAARTEPGTTSSIAPVQGVALQSRRASRRAAMSANERGGLRLKPVDARDGRVDPTLRLYLLARLQSVQEPAGGRSLFETGPSPELVAAQHAMTGPKIPINAQPVNPQPAMPSGPVTPVANIPLKFYGFVNPESKKETNRGLFLDGDNILVAAEGDVLDHQYLVVELSANSARLEDVKIKQGQTSSGSSGGHAAVKRPDNSLGTKLHGRRLRQRGSALLIVFVFAAVIAIMLYREMPVTLFEAKRQKEQLLVDRGHEYIRAVQLYYRRFRGQYPASIEQLEGTNNMRFLRHRFKDPFTGKDDWRLLHAGPGGMLIDSKVNPVKQPNTSNGTSGAGLFATTQQPEVGQPAAVNAASSDAEVVVQPVHARPPAITASGSDAAGATPTSAELDQNPATPLLPSSEPNGAAAGSANAPQDVAAQGVPVNGSGNSVDNTLGNNANNAQQGPNAMNSVQSLLSSSANRLQPQQGLFGQTRQPGQFGGGALAGIASKATGHTIKLVNDQGNYSLWEFYYDPSKDTSMSAAGGMGIAPGQPGGLNNTNVNSGTPGVNNSGLNNASPINIDPNATVGTAESSAGAQPSSGGNGNANPGNVSPGTPVGPVQNQ